MTTTTTVASVNMQVEVPGPEAEAGLRAALEGVDAAGLQEWGRNRNRILRKLRDFSWHRPLRGGGPVVVRKSRYRHIKTRARMLVGAGRVDRVKGRRTLLGPSWATVSTYHDTLLGCITDIIDVHLTAGVQKGKTGYRHDRPKRVRRHKRERRALARLVRERLALGHRVYVVGDTNYHDMHIPGLVSCWDGRPTIGTEGSRTIDIIAGPYMASHVDVVESASDHDHPRATYLEGAPS